MSSEKVRYHAMARVEEHGGFVFKDFDNWDSGDETVTYYWRIR